MDFTILLRFKAIAETGLRTWMLPEIIKKLNQILVGYYHYYGITDNIRSLSNFYFRVRKSLFYWLNRRSQKKSYSWSGFNAMLAEYPLATPKIYRQYIRIAYDASALQGARCRKAARRDLMRG